MTPVPKSQEVGCDSWTLLIRQRQEDLRSLAADIAQGRRAREDARLVKRRPLRLRLAGLIFGPR